MRKFPVIVLCVLAGAMSARGQAASFNPPVRLGAQRPLTPVPTASPIFRRLISVPASPNPVVRISTAGAGAGKRYWDPFRSVNPNGPAKGDPKHLTKQDFKFPVRPFTPLRDGRGNLLGRAAPGTRIQINRGAEKVMIGPDGRRHVYELAVGIRFANPSGSLADRKTYGTALVRRSAIPVKDRPPLRLPERSSVKGPTTAYAITGGKLHDKDLGYFNARHEFVPYKFGHGKPARGYTQPHRQTTDNTVHRVAPGTAYVPMLSRLPGHGDTATTVLRVDKNHPITFHRLKDVHSRTVKLYKAGGSTPKATMTFIKGYVVDPKTKEKTVGWMAQKAMKPKSSLKKEKGRKREQKIGAAHAGILLRPVLSDDEARTQHQRRGTRVTQTALKCPAASSGALTQPES